MRAPKGTPKRSRDLRSLQVTFHASLLVKRPPLERILRNFRLRMRTCKGTSERVTSGSPVGHAQWYYCTTTLVRKKAREPVAHAQNILPVTSGQELFRSCDFRWRHFRSSMRNGKILWIFRKCDLNWSGVSAFYHSNDKLTNFTTLGHVSVLSIFPMMT
jgi:hypothetical protein